MQDHDVVGIGDAIVDIIARCDDAFLSRHELHKGGMRLVDEAQSPGSTRHRAGMEISAARAPTPWSASPRFGGRAGLIGRTARDQFARVRPRRPLSRVTFTTPAPAAGSDPTRRCLVLITPDSQRP